MLRQNIEVFEMRISIILPRTWMRNKLRFPKSLREYGVDNHKAQISRIATTTT